jgi:hypothetical protein
MAAGARPHRHDHCGRKTGAAWCGGQAGAQVVFQPVLIVFQRGRIADAVRHHRSRLVHQDGIHFKNFLDVFFGVRHRGASREGACKNQKTPTQTSHARLPCEAGLGQQAGAAATLSGRDFPAGSA